MKIIRYLLSHIVLILVVVALVLAFYYRDFLFTERVNASIDNTVGGLAFWRAEKSPPSAKSASSFTERQEQQDKTSDAAEAPPSAPIGSASSSATYSTSSTHQEDKHVAKEGPQNDLTGSANVATVPPTDAMAMPSDPPDEASGGGEDESVQVADQTAAAIESGSDPSESHGVVAQVDSEAMQVDAEPAPSHAESAELSPGASPDTAGDATAETEQTDAETATEQLAQADKSPPPAPDSSPDPQTQAVSKDDDAAPPKADLNSEGIPGRTNRLIRLARNAFQQGDMKEAEKYYQEFIETAPQDPNAYGELGNVYYEQGKWEQAGEAYYEAAVRLLAIGETSQVEYLYRIIQGLHPQSAEKLQQKMAGQ